MPGPTAPSLHALEATAPGGEATPVNARSPRRSLAVEDLARWISGDAASDPPLDAESARRFVHDWTRRHEENFPVLSSLVPPRIRDGFAAVYAFCRAADDLGDEAGDSERALAMLAWWRQDLERAFDPSAEPRHPVFIALREVAARHGLDAKPFHDLVDAFELDQTKSRYATWDEVVGYCRKSADPVGRIVLRLFGEREDAETLAASDAVCTGLQLANHWQDVRRDLEERDRIYVPSELVAIDRFEERLRATADRGFACDATFLAESRELVRGLVERTWPCFEHGRDLLGRISPEARPVVELFIEGGEAVLRRIESWDFETVLHRPRIGRATKAMMVGRAWVRSRLARRRKGLA
jgi:squalene synthase HpnC